MITAQRNKQKSYQIGKQAKIKQQKQTMQQRNMYM